jgi:methionine-rich copper-binding protein CopC
MVVPRALIRAALAALLVLLVPAEGWSHAYLVRSAPAARTTIGRSPERIQLWFNERLEPAYSRLSVWNRDGQRVDGGDVQVASSEPTRLSVGVPTLPPGAYTVKFRVLSVDGHVVEAEYVFTVRGGS